MYYLDMPSAEDIGDLNLVRADACISIYLPTTPVSRDIEKSRINLGNLVKKAVAQLEAAGLDKSVLFRCKSNSLTCSMMMSFGIIKPTV